ncbi:hypothetical protein Pcinc_027587 [Petrolisthes cinctipes]|uniref:Cuticle protein n=1 Tax=Petrolisthes cinctipes TaxID=88211 RepID=A0AAE1K8F0_PETCI|nr:hypothetical protein Pcinc_027587 [Petrolisthes cinctipes]
MVAAQVLIFGLVVVAVSPLAKAAPQFDFDSSEEVTPYEFGYGVSYPETGDAKEHKETVSPSGRTEGEYRWLQPNGLYRIVRYFVEGNSGFQAEVSEEPGPDITNYYTNSLTQENSNGVPLPSSSQGFAKSLISTGPAPVNVITPSRTFRPQPQQTFVPQRQQSFQPQQPQQSFTNVIDGGFIDGGFIDGGIIDGGIIDGGIIDGGFINDDSFEDDGFSTIFG